MSDNPHCPRPADSIDNSQQSLQQLSYTHGSLRPSGTWDPTGHTQLQPFRPTSSIVAANSVYGGYPASASSFVVTSHLYPPTFLHQPTHNTRTNYCPPTEQLGVGSGYTNPYDQSIQESMNSWHIVSYCLLHMIRIWVPETTTIRWFHLELEQDQRIPTPGQRAIPIRITLRMSFNADLSGSKVLFQSSFTHDQTHSDHLREQRENDTYHWAMRITQTAQKAGWHVYTRGSVYTDTGTCFGPPKRMDQAWELGEEYMRSRRSEDGLVFYLGIQARTRPLGEAIMSSDSSGYDAGTVLPGTTLATKTFADTSRGTTVPYDPSLSLIAPRDSAYAPSGDIVEKGTKKIWEHFHTLMKHYFKLRDGNLYDEQGDVRRISVRIIKVYQAKKAETSLSILDNLGGSDPSGQRRPWQLALGNAQWCQNARSLEVKPQNKKFLSSCTRQASEIQNGGYNVYFPYPWTWTRPLSLNAKEETILSGITILSNANMVSYKFRQQQHGITGDGVHTVDLECVVNVPKRLCQPSPTIHIGGT